MSMKMDPGAVKMEQGAAEPMQEFIIRVPQQSAEKTYNLMKFGGSLGVEPSNWNSVEMVREDNRKVYESTAQGPEFGAGSEFGKAARDEARRKRRGFQARRYKHHAQAWLLTPDNGRRYRGMKEGGAGQNADYWVFVKSAEGVFEAHHISDWYQFLPIARHKTLDIDEAEDQFKARNKVMNKFALKTYLAGSAEEEGESSAAKPEDLKKAKNAAFKISDRDEYSSDSDEEDELVDVKQEPDEDGEKKKKGKSKVVKGKKKPVKNKKKVVKESEEVASGESSDGDEEGREVADYMSDSGSEPEGEDGEALDAKVEEELVGVDAERGLRTLLSDNDDDDEDDTRKTKIPGTSTDVKKDKGSDSDSGSDSDDPDEKEIKSAVFLQEKTLLGGNETGPGGHKRPPAEADDAPAAKRKRTG